MKIFLISPVHWHALWTKQKADELRQYGQVRTPLVIGQGQYFWWKALLQLGHEVEVHRYSDPTPVSKQLQWTNRLSKKVAVPGKRLHFWVHQQDIALRNQRLIEKAKTYQPDLVLVSGGMGVILAKTIARLKQQTKAKIVHLNGTSPLIFADSELKKAVPYYDHIFTNDFYHYIQFLELKAKKAMSLPISACDQNYHRRYQLTEVERRRYSCDVCFVGALAPANLYSERVQLLEALADFNLGIWSNDESLVQSHPLLAPFYRGRAYGIEMLKVLSAAKIALNFHSCTVQRGGNMRTFEIPAAGTFQLIDRYDPTWFEEKTEIVSFDSPSDLRRKVTYYLENGSEREAIAKKGQARAYKDHTYVIRMSQLVDLASSNP